MLCTATGNTIDNRAGRIKAAASGEKARGGAEAEAYWATLEADASRGRPAVTPTVLWEKMQILLKREVELKSYVNQTLNPLISIVILNLSTQIILGGSVGIGNL